MPEEKVFNIPLREAYVRQRNRRASNAIKIINDYLEKHMKTEDINIGKSINEIVWKQGIENPPRKVRIHVIKEDGVVYSELLGIEIKTPSAEETKKKKEKKEGKEKKIKEDRKERKKKTIQDEIKEESEGKSKDVPNASMMEESKEPAKITS
jgi:large subunit ribosomal protein L31e